MALENKYPTKLNNQLIPPPESYVREMPIPAVEIFQDADYLFQSVHHEWAAYIIGRLHELADEQRWEGTDADKWNARQQIEEFLSGDSEIINAEWVVAFDFLDSNEGFSVVTGEGGTWTLGTGWVSTTVGSDRQVHIEKNLGVASGVKGLLLLFSIGTNNATSHELEIKLRQNGSDVTYYSAAAASGQGQSLLLETSVYANIDRIRLRAKSVAATSGFLRFARLILWGEGDDPF